MSVNENKSFDEPSLWRRVIGWLLAPIVMPVSFIVVVIILIPCAIWNGFVWSLYWVRYKVFGIPIPPKYPPETILEDVKEILKTWAKSNGYISKVYLYGSFVTGDFKWDSDLDIAVEIKPTEGNINSQAAWISHGTNWERELQSLMPQCKVHLEWYDESETERVRAGVESGSILVYSRTEEKQTGGMLRFCSF
ncbi:MAG: nucleotidyltransferase family protein [Planctomycetota bacterium]|jgi:predicted nucleotidyltransferase